MKKIFFLFLILMSLKGFSQTQDTLWGNRSVKVGPANTNQYNWVGQANTDSIASVLNKGMKFFKPPVFLNILSGVGAPKAFVHLADSTAGQMAVPVRVLRDVQTGASSYIVDMSSYYNLFDEVEIDLINYTPSANAQELDINFSDDGTTFDATAAHYSWAHGYLNSAATAQTGQVSTGDTKIKCVAAASNLATSSNTGVFKLSGMSDAARFQAIKYEWNYVANASDQGVLRGSGRRLVAGGVKAIKFTPQSGTMDFTIDVWAK